MQALRGAKFRAAEGMGDHDVINNGEAEHGGFILYGSALHAP
jgi:hypothetical protein